MSIVLALDAGTGSAKCVAVDDEGRVRGYASKRWKYTVVANEHVPMVKEYAFDPEEFWRILCACAKQALSDIDIDEVDAVVTTSQREGCVFLDRNGNEIYAGPNLDSRGFMEGLEILEEIGATKLYEITGHSAPFIFPLARYLWFRKNDSRPVARILMLNDWILYRATGELVSEPSNATESMLFDFRQREWSKEILSHFEIDPKLLPRVNAPGTQVGQISRTAAAELGVRAGVSAYLGGADTQCALLGTGAVNAGDCALILGTTTPIQLVTDKPLLDKAENSMGWAVTSCPIAGLSSPTQEAPAMHTNGCSTFYFPTRAKQDTKERKNSPKARTPFRRNRLSDPGSSI